jgi:U3 small nucleolar RNA-associated protein 13
VAPNNEFIATGSQDKTARLWTVPDLIPLKILEGHSKGILSLDFSPYDKVLATSSSDLTIRLWSLKSGSCVRILDGHKAAILRICFWPNGVQLLSADARGIKHNWNIKSGELNASFAVQCNKVWALCSSEPAVQDKLLIFGGEDCRIVFMGRHYLQKSISESRKVPCIKQVNIEARPFRIGCYFEASRACIKLSNEAKLTDYLKHLSMHTVTLLFDCCRKWMTCSHSCNIAQVMTKNLLLYQKGVVQREVTMKCYHEMLTATKCHFLKFNTAYLDFFLSRIQHITVQALFNHSTGEIIDWLSISRHNYFSLNSVQ